MDEMTDFERQVAAEVRLQFGPKRPVDAAAIARSAMAVRPLARWSIVTRRVVDRSAPPIGGKWHRSSTASAFALAGIVLIALGSFLVSGVTVREGRTTVPGAAAPSRSPAVLLRSTYDCDWTSYWPNPSAECSVTATDPRVAGTLRSRRVGSAGITEPDATLIWGEATLEAADGRWDGHWYVVRDPGGTNHWLTVLSGDGANDGWTYVYGSDVADDPVRPWSDVGSVGLLYQGVPPVGVTPPTGRQAVPAGPLSDAVVVTGDKMSCAGWGWGVIHATSGHRTSRDVPCREAASDPRAHGAYVESIVEEHCGLGCVRAGDFVLTAPEGTWEGAFVRLAMAPDVADASLSADLRTATGRDVTLPLDLRVATGTGAYAGWTYVSHVSPGGRLSGLMFRYEDD